LSDDDNGSRRDGGWFRGTFDDILAVKVIMMRVWDKDLTQDMYT
jgi:hypothetical protein